MHLRFSGKLPVLGLSLSSAHPALCWTAPGPALFPLQPHGRVHWGPVGKGQGHRAPSATGGTRPHHGVNRRVTLAFPTRDPGHGVWRR